MTMVGCGCVRCVYPYRWSVCGKRVHQRRVHLSASALRVRIFRFAEVLPVLDMLDWT